MTHFDACASLKSLPRSCSLYSAAAAAAVLNVVLNVVLPTGGYLHMRNDNAYYIFFAINPCFYTFIHPSHTIN